MKTVLTVLFLLAGTFCAAETSSKTIYVSGNNQSAQTIRKKISKGKSCFTLASNKDGADSILEVAEDRNEFPLLKVSGTLNSASGDLIWAKTRGAAEGLFADMRKAVCQ